MINLINPDPRGRQEGGWCVWLGCNPSAACRPVPFHPLGPERTSILSVSADVVGTCGGERPRQPPAEVVQQGPRQLVYSLPAPALYLSSYPVSWQFPESTCRAGVQRWLQGAYPACNWPVQQLRQT
jgi:hypothetical protein